MSQIKSKISQIKSKKVKKKVKKNICQNPNFENLSRLHGITPIVVTDPCRNCLKPKKSTLFFGNSFCGLSMISTLGDFVPRS